MKTKEQILEDFGCSEIPFDEMVTMFYPAILSAMDEYANQYHNQAVKDCHVSATAYITQESVNGGKVAKVNSESILKNLKK